MLRLKKRAEIFIDHNLVVCILRSLNHLKTRKGFRAFRAFRIKLELLAKKKVRHTFASKVASLFRKILNFTKDVEIEWDLFKSAVNTFTAASCACKRVGDQTGSKKSTAWRKQEVSPLKDIRL